jgi:hypothetical protein
MSCHQGVHEFFFLVLHEEVPLCPDEDHTWRSAHNLRGASLLPAETRVMVPSSYFDFIVLCLTNKRVTVTYAVCIYCRYPVFNSDENIRAGFHYYAQPKVEDIIHSFLF